MERDEGRLSAGGAPDAATIEIWLVGQVAELVGADPATIDARRPFSYLGLSSAQSVILAGDLERWLGGRMLSPTLAWDYPTIEKLARHLADAGTIEVSESPTAGQYTGGNLDAILDEVERSPEEPVSEMGRAPEGGPLAFPK